MKKISAVLLVLVLVGSVAFAGFTGNATTGVGFDLDTGEYGFIKQSTAVSVDLVFQENLGEAMGEGDIYASIKATLNFTFDNADEDGVNDTTELILGDTLDFDHAKIFGDNWYVSILSAARAANFATSAIDSDEQAAGANVLGYDYDDTDYYADLRSRDIFDRTSGVEVGYAGYVLGIGFKGDSVDNVDGDDENNVAMVYDETGYKLFVSLATPEFELGDGLTAKFGVAGFTSGATEEWDADTAAAVAVGADSAASVHAKVAYADDMMSASVGADAIYNDSDFDFDVALKAAYDIVSLDAYFATKSSYVNTDVSANTVAAPDNLLSAKVAVDLAPMTITVTGKDLVDAQDLSASVKYQVNEELAVTGRGGYKISDKSWNGGADVEYVTADYTAKLGGTFRSTDRVSLSASVESTTVIPGATLKLAYAGDDVTEVDAYDPADARDNGNKGKVLASVKIAF